MKSSTFRINFCCFSLNWKTAGTRNIGMARMYKRMPATTGPGSSELAKNAHTMMKTQIPKATQYLAETRLKPFLIPSSSTAMVMTIDSSSGTNLA